MENEEILFNKLYSLFVENNTSEKETIKTDESNKINRNTLYLFPSYLSGDSEDKYYKSTSISLRIKRAGYSVQLYYDIFILRISNIKDRPKCIVCGETACFDTNNAFVRGYQKSCSSHKKEAIWLTLQLKENREKQRNSHKGWVPSDELRKLWSSQRSGAKRNHSKEYIDYLIKRNKEFNWTQELRDQISEKALKRLNSNPNSPKKFKRGWYNSEILNKNIHFDSSWEEFMIKYLESMYKKGLIKSFDRCDETVSYIGEDGFNHKYIPDFKVILEDGRVVILEIKPYHILVNSEKIKRKRIAGLKYFKKMGYKYITLTEFELFKNIKGSFNLFDYIV